MKGDYTKYSKVSDILKALAHPVRLCIINGLIESGESNVTDMQGCLDTPQSTTSQHLQKLKAMGIVECRRNGLEVFYKVNNALVLDLIKVISSNV